MLYLAIDLGEKRTGLAVGDAETKIASPAGVFEIPRQGREGALLDAIAAAAREFGAGAIVLGLPVNMDGSEGPASAGVRDFGARLAALIGGGIAVHFQDERLTSYAADQRLNRSGKTHKEKKRLRDQLAAVEILSDFFQSDQSRSGRSPDS